MPFIGFAPRPAGSVIRGGGHGKGFGVHRSGDGRVLEGASEGLLEA